MAPTRVEATFDGRFGNGVASLQDTLADTSDREFGMGQSKEVQANEISELTPSRNGTSPTRTAEGRFERETFLPGNALLDLPQQKLPGGHCGLLRGEGGKALGDQVGIEPTQTTSFDRKEFLGERAFPGTVGSGEDQNLRFAEIERRLFGPENHDSKINAAVLGTREGGVDTKGGVKTACRGVAKLFSL